MHMPLSYRRVVQAWQVAGVERERGGFSGFTLTTVRGCHSKDLRKVVAAVFVLIVI